MTIAVTRTGVPATSPAAGNAAPDGTVQYLSVGALELESGAVLPEVVLAYETWGTLNADASNAVLIEHALTGDTHVTRGAGGEPGWWEQLAGPGAPVDTDRYFVVSINILGGCYGSTGPSTPAPDGRPWGSRFPLVTLRDSTAAEARLADALGIHRWHAVLGGSLGGARALEWAVSYPERVRRCAVIAVGAYSTAEQIAFAQAQTLAIRQDPRFNGGDYYGGPEPHEGLALARRIAHITYRSAAELEGRFGRTGQDGETPLAPGPLSGRGRYQVESYLERVRRCAVIAVGAYSTAEQIAFAQAQTLAIRQDPRFNGGDYYGGPEPHDGLALARRIAHITYRSAAELEGRFGRAGQDGETPLAAGPLSGRGRYQVESYLDHQGNKLVQRFDANSYIAITEALMSHDVARGRGSLQQALAGATAEFFIAAVDSDRLYFPEQSRELAAALPGEVPVHVISAPIGHDGFLTEIGQLGGVLREAFFA